MISTSLLESFWFCLANYFGSVDHAVDNSSLNMLGMAWFEMQISSSVRKFSVHTCE
jgi:hypothetical protein